jgi:hypothetical protein
MTINVTPAPSGQVIRSFEQPVVREVPLPAASGGSSW